MTTPTIQPALEQIKAAQQKVWGLGDFAVVARHTVFPGELLCEAADLRAGERVLDVATGSGNVALSAARRGATVTGMDYVPELLEVARLRAAAERLEVTFEVGDTEALPAADDSYDAVLSLFGAMFAPNHQKAADELVRVCRPGGRIVLGNWTPEGFIGQVFAAQSRFVPPPAGIQPPVLWGSEQYLRELFGRRVRVERVHLRLATFRDRSAEAWLDFFRRYFGPVMKAFEKLNPAEHDAFARAQTDLANQYNRADDGTLVMDGEYLETVMIKE